MEPSEERGRSVERHLTAACSRYPLRSRGAAAEAERRYGGPSSIRVTRILGSVIFTWDPGKAAANLKKHGVDFREGATVFDDSLSTTFPDSAHSISEQRFLTIGMSAPGQLLVVAHTEQGQTIRIISARPVTRHERTFYEEDQQ